ARSYGLAGAAWRAARGRRFLFKLVQSEPPGQTAQQAVFFPFHFLPSGWMEIVMALEMQDAVDEIAGQFQLPGGPETPGLRDGLARAYKNLAVQHRGGP